MSTEFVFGNVLSMIALQHGITLIETERYNNIPTLFMDFQCGEDQVGLVRILEISKKILSKINPGGNFKSFSSIFE